MRRWLLLALVACSDPAPAPDRATVEQMRAFCKLAETPFEQRGVAMARWVERARADARFAATWTAMIDGDQPARAKLLAAADAAVGKHGCDILESFGQP